MGRSVNRRKPRTSTVIVTGAGGVGKTTIAAATAIASSRAGMRTLVLTVDPARRLADALGIEAIGNAPTPVSGQAHLWAAMLDVTASWEGIISRHAEPDVAARLEQNPFFRAIADRFPAAQSYAAGEQLAEYLEAGAWEVVIVDTPPAGGGIDFFEAPSRMRELIGGRVLRWVTGAGLPGRRALYRITARPMLRLTDNVLGGPLLEEVAEFLLDLRTLYDGLARRARVIERYFAAATTVVVTTAYPTPLREARRFFEALPEVAAPPAAVIFNLALPAEWADPVPELAPGSFDAATQIALHVNLERWGAEARHQDEVRREFANRHETVPLQIPWLEHAPTSIDALAALVDSTGGRVLEVLDL
jgi:anion-transporting  ArsA/GET3 family ATPase